MKLSTLLNLFIIFDIALSEIISTNIDINKENIGATSLKNQGLVFFAGGLSRFSVGSELNVKNVDIYNINTNQWSTAELSFGRYEVSATSLQTKGLAFFAGGSYVPGGDMTKNSILCNNVDIYNAITNTWTTSALSVNRSGIASTALDKQNLVFFAGGYITIANGYPEFTTDTIDIYNATSQTWSTHKLFIKNMYVMATALSNYGLAFMGGAFQKKLSVYNANTNTWSEMDISLEVQYGAGCSLDSYGLSFFGGGATQNGIISNVVDIYDAKTGIWSKSYFSSVRAGVSCSSLDKYGLVFFAGGGDSQNQLNTVDVYNANTGTWSISYINARKANIASASLIDFAFFGGGFSTIDTVSGIDIFGSCTKGISQINSNSCLGCPAGYFCNYQITPIICPIGSYCEVNVSKPDSCPAGTYNDVIGKNSINDCKKCPIGTYNGNLGIGAISGCLPCQYGTYCKEGSIVSQACPENNYCPNPTTKINCPAGTYLDETFATAASSCKKCFKGHYCNGKGGSPIPCSPGTYSNVEGLSECETCPGGNACPFGATNPLICEMNYVSKKGSSACTACPSGTYTTGEGTTDCISCAGGQFDVSGWWCMSTFEKILFISVWGGTALSVYATIKKMYEFITGRLRKIREAGLSFTWRRFIFIKSIEERIPNFEMSPQISHPVEIKMEKYNERAQYLPAEKSLPIERRPRRHNERGIGYERSFGYERGTGINFERGTGLYLKEDSPVLPPKPIKYSPLHLPKDNVVLDMYLEQIKIDAQQTSNLSQRENENISSIENISATQGSQAIQDPQATQGSQDTLNVSNIRRNVQLNRSRTMRQPPSLANIPRKSQMNLNSKKNIII